MFHLTRGRSFGPLFYISFENSRVKLENENRAYVYIGGTRAPKPSGCFSDFQACTEYRVTRCYLPTQKPSFWLFQLSRNTSSCHIAKAKRIESSMRWPSLRCSSCMKVSRLNFRQVRERNGLRRVYAQLRHSNSERSAEKHPNRSSSRSILTAALAALLLWPRPLRLWVRVQHYYRAWNMNPGSSVLHSVLFNK